MSLTYSVPCLLSLLLLLSVAGCSTVMNVSGRYFAVGPTNEFPEPRPRQIYGGTRLAARMGWDYVTYRTQDGAELFAVPYGLGIWAIDMPLSLVGDTLTLPVTVPAEINYAVEDYYFPLEEEAVSAK